MIRCFISVIFLSLVFGHNPDAKLPNWKQYFRLGAVQTAASSPGLASYVRLNRTTPYIFQDVRFYGHFFKDNQEIRVRQKTSRRFMSFDWLYSFNTLIYEKNTFIDVNLRYHFNQGFGWLIRNSESGNMTAELGIAFDNSDYLNTKQKTSYARGGLYWDHDTKWVSTKLEIEYFHQISEVVVENLSRTQAMAEIIIPINKGFSATIIFEIESYRDQDIAVAIDQGSMSFSLGWKGTIPWTW